MSNTTKRQPSAVTLSNSAHNRAARLREKIKAADASELRRRGMYDKRLVVMNADLLAAEKRYRDLAGTTSLDASDFTHDTPTVGLDEKI